MSDDKEVVEKEKSTKPNSLQKKAKSLEYHSSFHDFGGTGENNDTHTLLATLVDMVQLIQNIKMLNDHIIQIGSNSAIEAARSNKLLAEFESLASDIEYMVERSETATEELQQLTNNLFMASYETVGVQLSERARDIIDKIDRNLFERNCDCQAWATFPVNIRCLTSGDEDSVARSCALLKHLCSIYEVYCDIWVVDGNGTIAASGMNERLIGKSQAEHDWCKHAMAGEVYVTDMFYCDMVKANVVSYNCPIKDTDGSIIGVLSTKFNWDFANEMLDKATVEDDNIVQVISKDGLVLSSKDREGILSSNISWLKAAQMAMGNMDGFSLETMRNGEPAIFGASRTIGYNEYKGKDWSVVITQPIQVHKPTRFAKTFDHEEIEQEESQDQMAAQEADALPVAGEESLTNENEAEQEELALIHSDTANRQLKACWNAVEEVVNYINTINFDVFLMSFNAAVKSERAGAEGRAFTVLAHQIRKISVKSKQMTEDINKNLKILTDSVKKIQHVKVKDAAWDCIDKVDRNLFERNCDVQAWTIFDDIIRCAETGEGADEACALLNNIHGIYEVYTDLFLVDASGNTVAAAINKNVIGNDFSNEAWFRTALQGENNATDMFFCKTTNTYSVAYSAPVKNEVGQIVGVLSTRFNWDFIYDIVDKTIVPYGSSVYLINNDGDLIASTDRKNIFERNFNSCMAFQKALTGERGVNTEVDKDTEQTFHIGYAQTKGYNRYEGKGWICLVYQPADEAEAVEEVSDQPADQEENGEEVPMAALENQANVNSDASEAEISPEEASEESVEASEETSDMS